MFYITSVYLSVQGGVKKNNQSECSNYGDIKVIIHIGDVITKMEGQFCFI